MDGKSGFICRICGHDEYATRALSFMDIIYTCRACSVVFVDPVKFSRPASDGGYAISEADLKGSLT